MATASRKNVCANEFWDYSLTFYGHGSNQKDLIYLQDSFGFNVNMILLVMYLQAKGMFVAATDLQAINLKNKKLDSLTCNFRKKRRALKVDNISKGLADYKTLAYQQLLTQELELEKQQQALIIELVKNVCKSLSEPADNKDSHLATIANLFALVEPVSLSVKEELGGIFARFIQAQLAVAYEFEQK
jgi:uncharacterized protein (TIGR02444 family)